MVFFLSNKMMLNSNSSPVYTEILAGANENIASVRVALLSYSSKRLPVAYMHVKSFTVVLLMSLNEANFV